MDIHLGPRTPESVRIYFQQAQRPDIKATLPQKAQTVEEALADYEKSLSPGATSFGRTIWSGESYLGDLWCYGIDPACRPGAMLSYCVFDPAYRSMGAATQAVRLFLEELRQRYPLRCVGAFTFADNTPSVRVLEKSGFRLMEEFWEEGRLCRYYEREME